MKLNIEVPINSVSFGHVSILLLNEFYKKGLTPNIFPISNQVDISAYDLSEDFKHWIQACASKARKNYSKKDPEFKLWHINGSEHNVSSEVNLFTFFELDQLTESEINILNNQKNIFVSSRYTQKVFESFGVNPTIIYAPLGFDKIHFKKLNKTYHSEGQIFFSIFGKFENRKHHLKAINAWTKRFGNNPNFILNAHIYNGFVSPEDNGKIKAEITKNGQIFNINYIGYAPTLNAYNDCLNACDIVIDMSGGEGFSMPSFHCVGLGKHAVIHNCTAMSDWANDKNAVLVESKGTQEVYDNMFFRKGNEFNQGNIFKWEEDEFISACEEAVKRYQNNPSNEEGLKIQKDYTWNKTVSLILETIKV